MDEITDDIRAKFRDEVARLKGNGPFEVMLVDKTGKKHHRAFDENGNEIPIPIGDTSEDA